MALDGVLTLNRPEPTGVIDFDRRQGQNGGRRKEMSPPVCDLRGPAGLRLSRTERYLKYVPLLSFEEGSSRTIAYLRVWTARTPGRWTNR